MCPLLENIRSYHGFFIWLFWINASAVQQASLCLWMCGFDLDRHHEHVSWLRTERGQFQRKAGLVGVKHEGCQLDDAREYIPVDYARFCAGTFIFHTIWARRGWCWFVGRIFFISNILVHVPRSATCTLAPPFDSNSNLSKKPWV